MILANTRHIRNKWSQVKRVRERAGEELFNKFKLIVSLFSESVNLEYKTLGFRCLIGANSV